MGVKIFASIVAWILIALLGGFGFFRLVYDWGDGRWRSQFLYSGLIGIGIFLNLLLVGWVAVGDYLMFWHVIIG